MSVDMPEKRGRALTGRESETQGAFHFATHTRMHMPTPMHTHADADADAHTHAHAHAAHRRKGFQHALVPGFPTQRDS